MKVLIAEDDLIPRRMLQRALTEWGYEVEAVADGEAAWQAMQGPNAPKLVILDWMMPGLDGPEICRRARQLTTAEPTYIILLTGRDAKVDIVAGLKSGANDYVTKPFDRDELQARVAVGRTVVELHQRLAERVRDLENALAQVKQLQGLLPICSYCKKVRDDQNYWDQVEGYFLKHSEVRFSHSICPECWQREVQPELDRMARTRSDAAAPPRSDH